MMNCDVGMVRKGSVEKDVVEGQMKAVTGMTVGRTVV